MKTFLSILLLAAQSALAQFSFEDLPFMAGANASAAFPPEQGSMALWYLADDYSTNVNGTALTNVIDKSNNSNNGTNTIALAPFLTNNVLNGHSAFAHVDQYLNVTQSVWKGVLQGEVFIVVKAQATNQTSYGLYELSRPGAVGAEGHPFTDGRMYENFGATGSVRLTSLGLPMANGQIITNWHIWNVYTKTNETQMRYDGDLIGGYEFAWGGFTNKPQIGISQNTPWKGWIAEVMIWTNVLTSTSREAVHAYFNARYAIAYTNTLICFYPTNFANCVGWWKADDLHGVFAPNAAVTNWPNAISAGANWTNRTAATCPLFHSNLFNGMPGLGFDAAVSNRKLLLDVSTIPLTNFTLLVVGRWTNNACLLAHSSIGNNQWRVRESGANQNLQFNGGSANSAVYLQPIGNLRCDVFGASAGQFLMYQNTFHGGSGAFGGTMDMNLMGMNVAAANQAGGDVAEIILFQRALNYDQIIKLYYCYLKPKYALP